MLGGRGSVIPRQLGTGTELRNSLGPILTLDFWLRISHIAIVDTRIKTELVGGFHYFYCETKLID